MLNVPTVIFGQDHFFNKQSKFDYFPLSVRLSYHPGLLGHEIYEYLDQASRLSNYNPTWSIEPEWRISDKWTLGLPVVVGSEISRESGAYTGSLANYYYTSMNFYYPVNGAYPNEPEYSLNYYGYYYDHYSYLNFDKLNKIHRPELIFQTGVSARFYPFGQKANAFYIGQKFSLGRGNYNQANFFIDVDTLGDEDYWGTITYNWFSTNQTVKYQPAAFTYFNYATSFGVDLNISNVISFNAEVAFSSAMGNRGPADSVFVSKFGEPYKFELTEKFDTYIYDYGDDFRKLRNDVIFRIKLSLLIKLGTRKEEN